MRKLILPPKKCLVCSKLFYREESGRVSDFKAKKFCSRLCFHKHNVGEKHGLWKGGRGVNPEGYMRINVGVNKRAFEHRLIMEKYLGRKLKKNEQVHHKDGNSLNNKLSNLVVLSPSEHSKYHEKNTRKKNKYGRYTK